MVHTDWLHGITIETYNKDKGCYNSVNIDKTVVVLNRFLKSLFSTTTTDLEFQLLDTTATDGITNKVCVSAE